MARSVTAASCVVTVTLLLSACNSGNRDGGGGGERPPARGGGAAATRAAAPAATRATTFTGTLRGEAVAIGGETTGWRLEGDGATGGMDVDVSKVRARAAALDGKRVRVAGRVTTRTWPERGEQQVLVAERIEEAPPAAAGAGTGAGR